jgi:hypothetical protein
MRELGLAVLKATLSHDRQSWFERVSTAGQSPSAYPTLVFVPVCLPVLAEKGHPLRDLLISPNSPKGLSILSDGSSNG